MVARDPDPALESNRNPDPMKFDGWIRILVIRNTRWINDDRWWIPHSLTGH